MFKPIFNKMPHLLVSRPTRIATPRLFSAQVNPRTESYAHAFVRSVFADIRASLIRENKDNHTLMNLELKEVIVMNHCEDAEKRLHQPSRLARHDAAIPRNWTLEKKLQHACDLRKKYYVEFALTGHPTELLAEDARCMINQLVKDVLKLGACKPASPVAETLKHTIKETIHAEHGRSWLQKDILTPELENERQDRLYLEMMEGWPEFNNRNIKQFIAAHQIKDLEDIHRVKSALTAANKYSWQHGWSWFPADIDGNFKKTAKTMSQMIPGLQTAILNWYLKKMQPLLVSAPGLQSAYDYMLRAKNTIAHGIYYNEKRALQAQALLLSKLDASIIKYPDSFDALMELRDLVDIVGFKGHLRQFLRESSKALESVFDEFFLILGPEHAEIADLLRDSETGAPRQYSTLSLPEKEKAQQYLRTDAKYFATLIANTAQFSAATKREVDIFSFVWTQREQFGCIISDTKNSNSLIEAIHLFAISAHMKGELFIDDVRESPVELVPLCETAQDLANLPDIITTMLTDSYLKEGIKARKRICYLAGPSDIGSKEGEFKHIDLVWAEAEINRVLLAHQANDPELAGVKVHVFHGSGNDSERQIGMSEMNLFSTRQGDGASAIAEPGAYSANVADVSGNPSENTRYSEELALFEKNYPAEAVQLKAIINKTVNGYHDYNDNVMSPVLTARTGAPAMASELNKSSRNAGAKTAADASKKLDIIPAIMNARAIGKVNDARATRFLVRRFISADALLDLSDEECRNLPLFFAESTVMRQVFLKFYTAIAVSNFERTWCKINNNVIPDSAQIQQWADEYKNPSIKHELQHLVAYAHVRADLMLRRIASAFYEPDSRQASVYFSGIKPLSVLPNELALGLLESGLMSRDLNNLGRAIRYDLLPRYARLETCLDWYQNNPNPSELIKENLVHALRGDSRLSVWPEEISRMRSWISALPVETLGLSVEELENSHVRLTARV